MHLLTIRGNDHQGTLGVRLAGGVLDVAAAALTLGPGPGTPPTNIMALLRAGEAGLSALRRFVEWADPRAESAGLLAAEDALRLGPAVPHPGKIICAGLNYRQHAIETNLPIPTTPVLFAKFSNTLCAHGDVIVPPPDAQKLDYEAELSVVIGRHCKDVSQGDALSHVFGYCNANDFTDRGLQFQTSQWTVGKSPDGFCPLGPYVVTADAAGDPQDMRLTCTVDGVLRQDSHTSDMVFSCAELISYISRYITLEPGDLILTGTPQGVIMGYPAPQPWLKAGQTMTVEVGRLGRLTNRVG